MNNALLGRTDLTIASGSQLAQVTPTAGAVTVLAGQAAWVDASAGTVVVTPPAVAVAAMFGVVDSKLPSGSFSAAHYASITNTGLNIEDPGAPGVLSNNPIKLQTPTMSVVWQADPTGSYFKVFGG